MNGQTATLSSSKTVHGDMKKHGESSRRKTSGKMTKEHLIADLILKEIKARLNFLRNVGLSYLNLARSAGTLSGGESQRIRLATQIGSGLTGVLYILDEPSIGLHQRDNEKLLNTLVHLRDLGNTLIVVEHDEDTMRNADYIVDVGPGAGVHGGEIVAAGACRRPPPRPGNAAPAFPAVPAPFAAAAKTQSRAPVSAHNPCLLYTSRCV